MTTYDVRVMNVGGGALVADLSNLVTGGQWARKLDTWDDATVKIGPMGKGCCEALANIRPWIHELWIRRDGETVFVGPIIGPSPGGYEGQIVARGLAYWLAVRFIRDAYDTTGAPLPMSTTVAYILASALQIADPNLLDFLAITSCDIPDERLIDVAVRPYIAWDVLRDIIGTYMHMASFGRQLLFWCSDGPCLDRLPNLTPDDQVTETPVVFDGDAYTTAAAVWNGRDGVDSIVGYAGDVDDYYGVLVERVHQDRYTTGSASAAAGAAALITRDAPLLTSVDEQIRLLLKPECSSWNIARVRAGSCAIVGFSGCFNQGRTMQVREIGSSWDAVADKPYVVLRERSDIVFTRTPPASISTLQSVKRVILFTNGQSAGSGTITVSAGDNRRLFAAFVAEQTGGVIRQPSAMTLGGVALTFVDDVSVDESGTTLATSVWYIDDDDIPTGSTTLSVTLDGALTGTMSSVSVVVLENVDQSVPPTDVVIGTSVVDATTMTIGVSATLSSDRIMSFFAGGFATACMSSAPAADDVNEVIVSVCAMTISHLDSPVGAGLPDVITYTSSTAQTRTAHVACAVRRHSGV